MTDQPNTEPATPARRSPLPVRLYQRIHPLVPIVLAGPVVGAGVVWFDPNPAVRHAHITPGTARFWLYVSLGAGVFFASFFTIAGLFGLAARVRRGDRITRAALRVIARRSTFGVLPALITLILAGATVWSSRILAHSENRQQLHLNEIRSFLLAAGILTVIILLYLLLMATGNMIAFAGPERRRAAARWVLAALAATVVFFTPINVGIVNNDREAGINATGYSTLIGITVVITAVLLWRALGRRPSPGVLVGHRPDGTAVYLAPNAPLLAALAGGGGKHDDTLPPALTAAADAWRRIEDQQSDILDRLDDITVQLRALSYGSLGSVETELIVAALQKADSDTPAAAGNGG